MGVPGEVARPFVGRRTERRLLRHLLDEAWAGRPGLVVISGVPGAGKTALLGWLAGAAAATGAGAAVLRTAGGTPSLPLAAVRRLVAPLPELVGARDRWLTTSDEPRVGEPPVPHRMVVELAAGEVVEALVARARRRPLVVLVDDADDLEPLSARVLEQVVVGLDDAGAGHGLQVLVALASGMAPDPDGFVARTLRLASARAVTLGGFDDHDVFEMLVSSSEWSSGSPPTPTLVGQVLEASGGLPLLVESEVDRRTAAPATSVRVRGIADALRVRLDKVDGPTRQLLTRAALLAEPWDVDELAAAAADPVAEVVTRIDDALAAGLVERDGTGERSGPGTGLRFCHPLLRAELAAALGPAPRAALHREIANGFAGPGDDRLLVRADHLLRAHELAGTPAGATADLVATLRGAGRVALRWGAWHEAARCLSAALAATPDPATEDPGERARHHLEAGLAAWFDHDAARCEAELLAALDLTAKTGDGELRLRAAIRLVIARVGAQPLRFGRRPAVGELEEALAAAAHGGVDPVLRVEGQAVLADALYASGEADRALALVGAARRLVSRSTGGSTDGSADGAMARLEMAEGLHRMAGLELADAGDRFGAGAARARAAGDPLAVLTLRARQALVALLAGAVDDACDELRSIEDEALRRRFWGEAGFATAVRAVAATLAGDAEAPAIAERARHLAQRSGHAYTAAVVAPVLAALAARRRGLDESAGSSVGDDGRRLPSAVGVLCAVEANDVAAARARWAAASWRHGRSGPPTLVGLTVLAALVEAGDLLGERAVVVGARRALVAADDRGVAVVLGWPATVARLLAVAARHSGDVDGVAGARFQVERALRLTERRGLPVERAKVLVELARLEPSDAAGALLVEAAGVFDAASMLGWVGRCEAVAHELGVTAELPSRVVDDRTILTDDVVGSTAANARLGDLLYLESLRVHDRIVRARLREHGGEEIKHTGDGLNAIFRRPADAVRCALAVQADIAAWRRAEPDLVLEVRCGLARGSLVPSEGDYFGLVQSAAARLCALAAPGEVLVSGRVAEGLAGTGLVVEPRGAHRLKGLDEPVEIARVSAETV